MRKAKLICGLFVAVSCGVAVAAPPARNEDTDWPCAQRRTGTISAAAVWSGPDLAQAGAWDQDPQAAALARKLASRRTLLEEADGLLDEFADKAGADKDIRLTRVFAGALELINAERDRVLAGVARYARGQNRLAEQVRKESVAVGDAEEKAGDAQAPAVVDAQTRLKWDRRIFDERSQSLTYVCETPKILEVRAFEIARRIQQRFVAR